MGVTPLSRSEGLQSLAYLSDVLRLALERSEGRDLPLKEAPERQRGQEGVELFVGGSIDNHTIGPTPREARAVDSTFALPFCQHLQARHDDRIEHLGAPLRLHAERDINGPSDHQIAHCEPLLGWGIPTGFATARACSLDRQRCCVARTAPGLYTGIISSADGAHGWPSPPPPPPPRAAPLNSRWSALPQT